MNTFPFLKRKNVRETILFVAILVVMVFFRSLPLVSDSVPYTFDQGRDFLKVQEIVRDHNPTLIGPTTGIIGIYHGVWWYYFLAIPYLLTGGNPYGFYYFLLGVNSVICVGMYFFLRQHVSRVAAFIFFFFAAISPYFSAVSVFPISSVFNFPFILLLFGGTLAFLKKPTLLSQIIIFFSLSMLFESEVPTGLFIIPSFFAAALFFGMVKKFISSKKRIIASLAAFFLPMTPRFLFEILHNFPQTRAVINFVLNPQYHIPRTFEAIMRERIIYFWEYYRGIFPGNNETIAAAILIVSFFIYFIIRKNMSSLLRKSFTFFMVHLLILFTFTLFYKDNFWQNYLEGLTFYFILLLSLLFGAAWDNGKMWMRPVLICAFLIVIFISVKETKTHWGESSTKKQGVAKIFEIVKNVYQKTKGEKACVRIYTPPVIPHTYNYIFSYEAKVSHYEEPTVDYVEGRCFYIIESDSFAFRIDQFRKDQIPGSARQISKQQLFSDVSLELWEYHE